MPRLPLRTRVLAGVVLASASALASLAIADGFDPATPATVVIGTPQGYAPRPRLDDARRGRSSVALPAAAEKLWSRELPGGLELPPVIDSSGALVAALLSPDVVRLAGEDGKQLWRARLGERAPVAPPVLTSDGSVAVVCGDGTLWSVAAGGGVRFATSLETRTANVDVTPLALDDGSVVVAGESELVHVGSTGDVQARASVKGRPSGALLAYEQGVLATTHDGEALHWRAPAAPRVLGSLGGRLDGGALLAGKRTLVAVVDRSRVVALDLKSGSTTLLMGGDDALAQLEGPPTLDPKGVLLVTTALGELIGIDAHGVLVRRTALEALPALFGADGGALPPIFRRLETRSSPPLVVDPAGRVAFVRASGKLGTLDRSGAMFAANARVCARPLAVLPAGSKRMLIACRSGSVTMYGDRR